MKDNHMRPQVDAYTIPLEWNELRKLEWEYLRETTACERTNNRLTKRLPAEVQQEREHLQSCQTAE